MYRGCIDRLPRVALCHFVARRGNSTISCHIFSSCIEVLNVSHPCLRERVWCFIQFFFASSIALSPVGRLGHLLGYNVPKHARVIATRTSTNYPRWDDFCEFLWLMLILVLSIGFWELDKHLLIVRVILNFVVFAEKLLPICASSRTSTLFE